MDRHPYDETCTCEYCQAYTVSLRVGEMAREYRQLALKVRFPGYPLKHDNEFSLRMNELAQESWEKYNVSLAKLTRF